jgi:hypothetical protein
MLALSSGMLSIYDVFVEGIASLRADIQDGALGFIVKRSLICPTTCEHSSSSCPPKLTRRSVLGAAPTNFTYLFIPRQTLSSLFSSFGMDLPSIYTSPFNTSKVLSGNDTLPEGTDINSLAMGGM